jgi:cellulose biosynthesis protein BcsQ/tetratricopeptide (TPR) repeat protein
MSDAETSQPPRSGQIVTFYSFKGGTGRTMALANVAWILAANGRRVLTADWDLESPGLHRFFKPFMDASVSERPGITDFIRKWEWAAADAGIDPYALHTGSAEAKEAAQEGLSRLIHEHLDEVKRYAIPLSWSFPGRGALHFWTSGKQADGDYQASLSALDWDNFYDRLYGGQFFDALRVYMKSNYDYVLIDSRTGLSDIADICTVHLPDIVVDCFTLSTQGVEGAAAIARMIERHTERNITILPVPMRIDRRQKDKVEEGLEFAAGLFEGLPAGMADADRREYWAKVEVPYRSSYACEEILAVFGDAPGSRTSLLTSYERIAGHITAGAITTSPPIAEWLRLRTRNLFSRTTPSSPVEVVLDFSPVDQLWAEWIAAVLAGAEISVRWSGETPAGHDDAELETQTVAIVTDFYIYRLLDSPPAVRPDLLICVTDVRLPQHLAEVPVIFLARLSEAQVMNLLIDRFGGRRAAEPEPGIPALPYPGGSRPQILNIPVRNANFTGRDEDLRKLRDGLRAGGVTVVLPLTILGLGGVGKTQVALEYAHRFRADYDIIWWMNCGQSQYVDASLADLGQKMRLVFEAALPEEGGVTEVAQQVLNFLREEFLNKRWLLIYDNAEDINEVKDLMPSGGGHVLITSRNEAWTALANSLKVDIFKRQDSISHLRRRMPGITDAEADELASTLGDIPLAVAAAGALLARTDMSVAGYLRQLRQQPRRTFSPEDPLNEYPEAVTKAWELSLNQLQQNSAAAARLLELCSVMAPDICLDLIVTQAMVRILRDLDPAISERTMISRLIRQIDLLALIKLDNNARQIQVNRVVQAVVNERMSEADKESARQGVHQLVVAAHPEGDVDDPQTWPRYRLIWPHLTPSGAMWSEDEQVRELLIERVRYLRQRDDLERGQRRAVEILGAWQTMLARGPEPEMAMSLRRQLFRLQFNLANILRDLALFQEARTVDEAVLAGQTEYLSDRHPHTLQTRGSLAADLRALGYYQEALEYDLETYRLWNREYGDDYRGTLAAAHNLALSYLLTGDFRNALDYDVRTLERRAAVLSPRHPRTLNSGAAVARDLLEAGRYADAVAQIDSVWAQCREILGDDDRATLNARLALGVAQRCAGHLDEAARHIDAARIGLTRGFGSDSSDALASRLSQALSLLAMDQVRGGMRAAEEVLIVYAGRLGLDHPHSLICMLNIATAACLEQDYEVAGTRVRSAVEGLEARLGTAHPYTLAAKMVQATALAHQGRLTEAAELEYLVASGRERILGPQHPDTLRSRANLLLTRQAQGVDGASRERQAIIAGLALMLGREHPDVATAAAGERLLCMIDPQPF